MSLISPAILNSLRESVRETFETLTFSEVSEWEVSDTFPGREEAGIGSVIDLHEPSRGRFAILLNREQCRRFIETAYGPEIEENAEEGDVLLQDYVNEIANTIAGRFAASLSSKAARTVIGLPKPFTGNDAAPGPAGQNVCVRFLIEDEPAWCFLTGEE